MRPQLMDWSGVFPLKNHSHVKIVNKDHGSYGQSGSIVRIQGNRVWVALPGDVVVPAGHRSVEVLAGEKARKARGGR